MISDENLKQLRALLEKVVREILVEELEARGVKKVPQDITEKRRAAALVRWAAKRAADKAGDAIVCKSNANASPGEPHKHNGSHANAMQVHAPRKATKRRQAFLLPEWLEPNRDVWEAWVEARSKSKHPPTDWAKNLAVAKLERMRDDGHNVRRLLADAAFNNWQSFYVKGD